MEKQIKDYKEMEESFEQMKEKYKYPEGKYLENEIKDNEILIIRAENTNLKNVINQLEKDKMNDETESKNDKEINNVKNQIELSQSKGGTSELTLKNINSNNSCININTIKKQLIKPDELLNPKKMKKNKTKEMIQRIV